MHARDRLRLVTKLSSKQMTVSSHCVSDSSHLLPFPLRSGLRRALFPVRAWTDTKKVRRRLRFQIDRRTDDAEDVAVAPVSFKKSKLIGEERGYSCAGSAGPSPIRRGSFWKRSRTQTCRCEATASGAPAANLANLTRNDAFENGFGH